MLLDASVYIVDIGTDDTEYYKEPDPSEPYPELAQIVTDEHGNYYEKYYYPEVIHDASFRL